MDLTEKQYKRREKTCFNPRVAHCIDIINISIFATTLNPLTNDLYLRSGINWYPIDSYKIINSLYKRFHKILEHTTPLRKSLPLSTFALLSKHILLKAHCTILNETLLHSKVSFYKRRKLSRKRVTIETNNP